MLAGHHAAPSRAVEAAWTALVSVEGPDEVRFSLPVGADCRLASSAATLREAIHRLRRSVRDINREHVDVQCGWRGEGHTGQAATLAAGLELQIGYDSLRVAGEALPWQVDLPQLSERLILSAPGGTAISRRVAGDRSSGCGRTRRLMTSSMPIRGPPTSTPELWATR